MQSLPATLALFGWLPITILLFAVLAPRRALLVSAVGGWLFLPVAEFELPGFVDYTKHTSISIAILLGVLAFDSDSLIRMRFNRYDVGMLVWCTCPMLTSVMNELGFYDGLSGVLDRTFIFAAPYVLGRTYFASFAGLRDLAIAIMVGGLLYVPFCWWEIRMSPQLHVNVYGYFAHSGGFAQVMRFGGWRPMVFMHHGLMLGLWMAMATLMTFGLWMSGTKRDLLGIPLSLLFLVLLVTTIQTKSSGAVVLLLIGVALLLGIKYMRIGLTVWIIALVPVLYAGLRTPGWWDGENLVQLVDSTLGPERAHSIAYRFEAEGLLAAKAMEQPIYGWGEHNRGRVDWDKSPDGKVVPDGQWIIALNVNGIIGIVSLLMVFAMPVLGLAFKLRPKLWGQQNYLLLATMCMMISLYMLDNLMNAMINPIYFVGIGGMTGYLIAHPGKYRMTHRRLKHSPAQIRWILEQRKLSAAK